MPGASDIRAGGAAVEVGADTAPAERDLKSFEKKLATVGASIASIGKKILLVGAAAAAPFIASTKAAADFNETMSAFEVTFGRLTPQARAFMDELVERLGLSRQEVAETMEQFMNFGEAIGVNEDEAFAMSKALTQLSFDMASFRNLSQPEVLAKFTSALAGETEGVRRLGINLAQVALDQELVNMGIEGGAKKATEAQKVMARYNIIMKSTQTAQGDLERTSESLTNQWRRFISSIKNLAITVGTQLEPTITPLVKGLANWVQRTGEWIQRNRELIPVIVKVIALILGVGAALFVAGKAMTLFAALFSPVGVFGIVITALALLLDGLGLINLGVVEMVQNFRIGGTKIKFIILGLYTDILKGWERVKGAFAEGIEWWKGLFDNAWNYIGEGFLRVLMVIEDGFWGLVEFFREGINDIIKLINTILPESKELALYDDKSLVKEGFFRTRADAIAKRSEEAREASLKRRAAIEEETARRVAALDKELREEMRRDAEADARKAAAEVKKAVPGGPAGPAPIPAVTTMAVTGVFGTFSGLVGRMLGGRVNVQARQLDEQKKANELLRDINKKLPQQAAWGP